MPRGAKRGLCVGINYPKDRHRIGGAVHDTLNWAKLLEKTFDFNEVRVLIDQNPDGSDVTHATQVPTRANILAQLGWLCTGAEPGDCLVFQFSGHGCQVRTNQHGEEVDEALVPVDFHTPDADGNPPLVYDDEIQALFARLPQGSSITCIFDCSHAGNMLDVPCSMDASHNPPRVKNACNRPMEVRMRNEQAWGKNRHANAHPRCIQGVNLCGRPPRQRRIAPGMGAHLNQMTLDPCVTAICFFASGPMETALDADIKSQQQGVMSFCLLEALEAVNYSCSYETLLIRANEILEDIRQKYMPSMDQRIQLSFCPNSSPSEVVAFDSRYSTVAMHRATQNGTRTAPRQPQSSPEAYPQQGQDVRSVEPQPQPGQAYVAANGVSYNLQPGSQPQPQPQFPSGGPVNPNEPPPPEPPRPAGMMPPQQPQQVVAQAQPTAYGGTTYAVPAGAKYGGGTAYGGTTYTGAAYGTSAYAQPKVTTVAGGTAYAGSTAYAGGTAYRGGSLTAPVGGTTSYAGGTTYAGGGTTYAGGAAYMRPTAGSVGIAPAQVGSYSPPIQQTTVSPYPQQGVARPAAAGGWKI
eukprot:gnl/TRDRNA2_/TRDRNA2_135146_c0_seq1.p1 gnl/TRDRNA2_/TRDRNA2_135146_c0~~gnl/TRDRNA2_/TRDRNA2_135146_c0_seq1.p1  ORF type:complete len:577 (+),score=87.13 gnl/TRDRNA2_/TRDRNA2_135146_c0_seq1:62-1792(+)